MTTAEIISWVKRNDLNHEINVGLLSQMIEELDTRGFLLRGYLLNGEFYSDSTYQELLPKEPEAIYLNVNDSSLYTWTGSEYSRDVKLATDTIEGIMKLYSSNGVNEDGTMTQKAISDGISAIKFDVDDDDNECLVLELPW